MVDAAAEFVRDIQLGEDSSLAFAEVVLAGRRITGRVGMPWRTSWWRSTNSSGGILWLGVSDGPRAVTGIPLEHLDAVERYVVEIADDAVTPPVVALIEKLPDAVGRTRPALRGEIPPGAGESA